MKAWRMWKTILIAILALIVAVLVLVLVNLFRPASATRAAQSLAYSEFVQNVQADQIRSVVMRGSVMTGVRIDGQRFQTYLPDNATLTGFLVDRGVHVAAGPAEEDPGPMHFFLSFVPLIAITGIWGWGFHRMARAIDRVAVIIGASRETFR